MSDIPTYEEDLARLSKVHQELDAEVKRVYPEIYQRLSTLVEDLIQEGLQQGTTPLKAYMYACTESLCTLLGRLESAASQVLGVPPVSLERSRLRSIEQGKTNPILRHKVEP